MGKWLPNTRMKSDRCWRSEVDSARGRAFMSLDGCLGRIAAAAYAERWARCHKRSEYEQGRQNHSDCHDNLLFDGLFYIFQLLSVFS
jgi:hypothetical protein